MGNSEESKFCRQDSNPNLPRSPHAESSAAGPRGGYVTGLRQAPHRSRHGPAVCRCQGIVLLKKKNHHATHCREGEKGNTRFSENLNWRSANPARRAKGNSVRCKGFDNETRCALGPDVWRRANGKRAVLSPKTVFDNWTMGLTVNAGPTKQTLDREYKRNSPAEKRKKKIERTIFTLGPVLHLELFSQWLM